MDPFVLSLGVAFAAMGVIFALITLVLSEPRPPAN